jgi:ABC-type transport system involved in multi-copper enzyme maturation permease subunit
MMGAIGIIARLSWLRFLRSNTKWLVLLLAAVPPLLAAVALAAGESSAEVWQRNALGQLPAILAVSLQLAPAVGEEIESKTYTYLWSRPMNRSALVLGNFVAIAPLVAVGFALSTLVVYLLSLGGDAAVGPLDLARSMAASALAVCTAAAMALGAGSLFPRRPLAFVLAYVSLEVLQNFLPALRQISIAHHAYGLAGLTGLGLDVGTPLEGLIGLGVLLAVWMGLAIWRVETTEYSLPDS